MTRNRTDFIIIHCAATKPDMDIGRKEIDRWHRARGWRCIGYHIVIRRNGKVEYGRAIDAIGAHARGGYNHKSVGICLVGGIDGNGSPEDNFTPEQYGTLKRVLDEMVELYPEAKIIGHNEVAMPAKACPSFDVQKKLPLLGVRQPDEVEEEYDDAKKLAVTLHQKGMLRRSSEEVAAVIRKLYDITPTTE